MASSPEQAGSPGVEERVRREPSPAEASGAAPVAAASAGEPQATPTIEEMYPNAAPGVPGPPIGGGATSTHGAGSASLPGSAPGAIAGGVPGTMPRPGDEAGGTPGAYGGPAEGTGPGSEEGGSAVNGAG